LFPLPLGRSVKSNRKTREYRRGVTLIDMVVVLIIVAILGSVALPRYSLALARYRVTATANRILADVSLAQSVAKMTSGGQTITFSTTNNNYQFSSYAGPLGGTPQANYTVSLSTDPYDATISSVSFNSTSQLVYDRYGQPANGGTVVVQVGTYTKTITVDPNTGKATAQ
jgi:Tfp pilus assembly protein FimT